MSGTTAYTYDELGQLISETNGNTTYEYAYDSKGNISSRKAYSGETLVDTDTFTYGAEAWEDRLTGYNNGTITYDTIGNPTSYLGATLTWRGRELSSYSKDGKQISYSYDVDGMRYKKTVSENNAVTAVYDYVYSDGKLILLTHTANGTANTARFIYDSFGEPRGFILNNSSAYLYLKNGQGDITAIVDENGAVLLTYSYTAWGEITYSATSMQSMLLAATLSNVNPFTYRGYCYDYDIGMYYLQSRYYDPQICRFINADSTDYLGATGTLLSYNLFAYCENDPVDYVDANGCATTITFNKGYVSYTKYLCNDDAVFYDKNAIPTAKDKINWNTWGGMKTTAKPLYPNGVKFYEHFRSGKGGVFYYNYRDAFNGDNAIKQRVNLTLKAIKYWINYKTSRNDVWYKYSTSEVDVQPETIDWKFALNGHNFIVLISVIYRNNTKCFYLYYTIVAYDRYNFNPGAKFLGIPNAWNNRFVTLGWAKNFTSVGYMQGNMIWRAY